MMCRKGQRAMLLRSERQMQMKRLKLQGKVEVACGGWFDSKMYAAWRMGMTRSCEMLPMNKSANTSVSTTVSYLLLDGGGELKVKSVVLALTHAAENRHHKSCQRYMFKTLSVSSSLQSGWSVAGQREKCGTRKAHLNFRAVLVMDSLTSLQSLRLMVTNTFFLS